MSNVELARHILQLCSARGIREFVLCAGARNAPFVALLSRCTNLHTYHFFEERAAAFFALGRVLNTERPVAVITTSGTAAAELLPATMEAFYQGLPLLLITADRPRTYRGSGAPQTVIQPGLFSHYITAQWDVEGELLAGLDWQLTGPAHINVCFDEPLLDREVRAWAAGGGEVLSGTSGASEASKGKMDPLPKANTRIEFPGKRALVVISSLPRQAFREQVVEAVRGWGLPVYAEGPSGLRGDPRLHGVELRGGEPRLAHGEWDSVIRIGGVPTLRLWRDLEKSPLPVLQFSHLPFSGRPSPSVVHPLSALAQVQMATVSAREFSQFLTQDSARWADLNQLLQEFPASEPAWVRRLSEFMAPSSRVFVGNSLPIREWDLAATRERPLAIWANRGVNGIDGLISTFLGLAVEGEENWCLLGDLSTLYDLAGPWPLRQLPINNLNLVVIHNGGGRIFNRLFQNPWFENEHELDFAPWAKLWNLDYVKLTKPDQLLAPAERPRVVEVRPDPEQTRGFWEHWERRK